VSPFAGFYVLGGDKGCRPFPRTPFSATGALPPLRCGQVFLDEAEHFLHNREYQRRYAPMVFGFPPECAFGFAGIPNPKQYAYSDCHNTGP